MNDVPNLSFGFIKKPSAEHDGPVQPVHVITEGKLLYLSLDLWPGPYQSIPEVLGADEDDT
jgi:hypothetical protein